MKAIRRFTVIILSCSLILSACTFENTSTTENPNTELSTYSEQNDENTVGVSDNTVSTILEDASEENTVGESDEEEIIQSFNDINDPSLLQYVEDIVYAGLVDEFSSEDYIIENVDAVYVSEEYLQELEYNSKSNIFFGYTLSELDEQFQGEKYIFTLGDEGTTVVTAFEGYDDTFEKVIKNVAIGTGVILVCVTVSVVTGGVGAAPISMIFATAAKSGAIMAVSSAGIGAVAAGAITGIQTHDKEQVIKSAALQGSESFKWGAILGAVTGGLSEANSIRKTSQAIDELLNNPNIPEWRRAELRALKQYGGQEQLSYIAGEEVPFSTPGATRPDVIRTSGNHLEAIEVKYYNLESTQSLSTLYSELEREVSARVTNLPAGSTQRVVLDVTGRNFSSETIARVTETIQSRLFNIYGSNIPVDIVGL